MRSHYLYRSCIFYKKYHLPTVDSTFMPESYFIHTLNNGLGNVDCSAKECCFKNEHQKSKSDHDKCTQNTCYMENPTNEFHYPSQSRCYTSYDTSCGCQPSHPPLKIHRLTSKAGIKLTMLLVMLRHLQPDFLLSF